MIISKNSKFVNIEAHRRLPNSRPYLAMSLFKTSNL